ncbi:hypothetical protein [Mesorhizobium muleiense]|uniref:hypothetical protein n=1 Tax=Mesorhizobium muleiense TaxID=1004279 RepID=UPI001F2C0253|nr:hypothetical protein [Mesorhizobium muleiense]MCF6112382.1 hypothetical protein [Mesorhizobium muleiense]
MARPATAAVRLLTGEREPVRLATTGPIWVEAGGLLTIDGVVTEVGDRVLVKDQDNGTQNGIYTVSEGEWFRAADARTARTLQKGTTVRTQVGTVNASRMFIFTTDEPVIGTDNIAVTFDATDHSSYVTLTGPQTLTDKTLTSPAVNGGTIASATLTLKQGTAPTPTAEGDIQWDTDDNRIVVGDGAAQAVFAKGPATTVDNTVPRFDGTKGATQTSGATIDDSDKVTASGGFYVGSARVGGTPDAVMEDQKSSGTGGGTPVATTWTTHALNTEVRDPSGLVSISSNEFTPTVDGWVEWEIRSYTVGSFGSRLQNITDGTTAGMGMLGNGNNGPSSGATSTGAAAVAASKAFAIQYYASVAVANGLGLALSQGTEVYARVKFWRTT